MLKSLLVSHLVGLCGLEMQDGSSSCYRPTWVAAALSHKQTATLLVHLYVVPYTLLLLLLLFSSYP